MQVQQISTYNILYHKATNRSDARDRDQNKRKFRYPQDFLCYNYPRNTLHDG